MLDSCIKMEEYELATEIFDDIVYTNNLTPDLLSISSLIKSESKSGEIDMALDRLNLLDKYNIMPDEVLFNSLLDGCSKNSRQDLSILV